VVVPLLGVKDTALLGISTPSDEFNYYAELKDAHGERLFHDISLGMVCAACKASGAACNHLNAAMAPAWKPAGSAAKVDAMSVCPLALLLLALCVCFPDSEWMQHSLIMCVLLCTSKIGP
jgi:hypothetical protein